MTWPSLWLGYSNRIMHGSTNTISLYPGSSSYCSCWMSDRLSIETKAEPLIWHHPSRRSARLQVANRLHQVPQSLERAERAICHPYQNWRVSYSLHLLPAGPWPAPLSKGSQSNWLIDLRSWLIINKPSLQQRSMAVRAWSGVYWFYHIWHICLQRVITSSASWRHSWGISLSTISCEPGSHSSGFCVDFKPMAVTGYCVCNSDLGTEGRT